MTHIHTQPRLFLGLRSEIWTECDNSCSHYSSLSVFVFPLAELQCYSTSHVQILHNLAWCHIGNRYLDGPVEQIHVLVLFRLVLIFWLCLCVWERVCVCVWGGWWGGSRTNKKLIQNEALLDSQIRKEIFYNLFGPSKERAYLFILGGKKENQNCSVCVTVAEVETGLNPPFV